MAGMIGLFGEGLLIKDGDKAIGDVLEKQTVSCTGRGKNCSGRMNAMNLLKKIKKKFTNGVSIGTPTSKINRYHTHSCCTMKLLDDLKDAELGVLMRSYNWHGSSMMEQGETSL